MFMEIPKKTSVNLPTTTGTGSVRRVLEDGASAAEAEENNSKILRNGPTVNGSGKPEAAAGQALLEMMSNPNGVVPVSGFFKGKTQEKDSVKGEATIEIHAAAFLADGPEANGKFQKLMELASRGAESSSGTVSQREIELGRQAVIPLDGPDAELGAALRYAFSLADRPPTAEDSIRLFKESNH